MAKATRPVASPPTMAITIDAPSSSRTTTRRRATSTALASQTAPNGSPQMLIDSDASAYSPRPAGSIRRPVTTTSSTFETSSIPRKIRASRPPAAIEGGRNVAAFSSCGSAAVLADGWGIGR